MDRYREVNLTSTELYSADYGTNHFLALWNIAAGMTTRNNKTVLSSWNWQITTIIYLFILADHRDPYQ